MAAKKKVNIIKDVFKKTNKHKSVDATFFLGLSLMAIVFLLLVIAVLSLNLI